MAENKDISEGIDIGDIDKENPREFIYKEPENDSSQIPNTS
jgi:hypothetical protein